MEKRAKQRKFHFLFSLSPIILYPSIVFLSFLSVLIACAFLLKREARTSASLLELLGIKNAKDALFLLLLLISALFVLMVLIFSLSFLPPSPPLPA